jgi:DNA-binding MarR family transcriptional regulator
VKAPASPGPRADRPDEIAGSLRTVIGRLSHRLRAPAIAHGITPTRLSALVALERAGWLRPSDLAAALGMSAASVSRLAEALQASDWVRRETDPEDGRACLLSLTDAGSEGLANLRRESEGDLADAVRALSEEQRRALGDTIPVLAALADRYLDAASTRR